MYVVLNLFSDNTVSFRTFSGAIPAIANWKYLDTLINWFIQCKDFIINWLHVWKLFSYENLFSLGIATSNYLPSSKQKSKTVNNKKFYQVWISINTRNTF